MFGVSLACVIVALFILLIEGIVGAREDSKVPVIGFLLLFFGLLLMFWGESREQERRPAFNPQTKTERSYGVVPTKR